MSYNRPTIPQQGAANDNSWITARPNYPATQRKPLVRVSFPKNSYSVRPSGFIRLILFPFTLIYGFSFIACSFILATTSISSLHSNVRGGGGPGNGPLLLWVGALVVSWVGFYSTRQWSRHSHAPLYLKFLSIMSMGFALGLYLKFA